MRILGAAYVLIGAGCSEDPRGAATFDGADAGDDDDDDDVDGTTGGETPDDDDDDDDDDDAQEEESDGGDPVKYDVGDIPDPPPPPSGGDCPEPEDPYDATLTGTVYAPDGQIPVSGAVVYTTDAPPPGIPQHVYCDECLEISCDDQHVLTDPDGTFSLPTYAGGGRYLVVKKGQFMRVTELDVDEGDAILDEELTTLPGVNEPDAGLYIPRIALGHGSYDRLEDALGKIGLGDVMYDGFGGEILVPGTESFDIWDNGGWPDSYGLDSLGSFADLVGDPERLSQYHVIFVPCSSDLPAQDDPTVQENIRAWVAAGGRWYVADWSNEWVGNVFPEYQTFVGDGLGTDLGLYDSLGQVLDQGLLEWLEALPQELADINPLNPDAWENHATLDDLPQVLTKANWSAIDTVSEVVVEDGEGNLVDVSHKVWIEGPTPGVAPGTHPLTVTGQFGCGKIQFTSYHTAEGGSYVGLTPQELVLVYTILEIGVCQEPTPPPAG